MIAEYEQQEFEIGFPEGFQFPDGDIIGWRDLDARKWTRTEDMVRRIALGRYPIRMVVAVVGFTDRNAPSRNWGDE